MAGGGETATKSLKKFQVTVLSILLPSRARYLGLVPVYLVHGFAFQLIFDIGGALTGVVAILVWSGSWLESGILDDATSCRLASVCGNQASNAAYIAEL